MPTESFRLSVVLPTTPEQVYRAWLDPEQHGAITGSPAQNDGRVGGRHSAWAGYITGTNVALERGRRIVQSWRTAEFPPEAPDSRLELCFAEVNGGTELVLEHVDLPEDQARAYEQGWVEHYFEPMKRHFARLQRTLLSIPLPSVQRPLPKPSPKKKPTAKKAKAKRPARKPASAARKARPAKKAKPAKASARKAKRPVKAKPKARGKKR